jgi:uncharacterized protein YjbJ (UPF0337 family)
MAMENSKSWHKVLGKWKEVSIDVKKQWSKLTDDEVMEVNGDREILSRKIQAKYGIAKELADRQIDKWADRLKV